MKGRRVSVCVELVGFDCYLSSVRLCRLSCFVSCIFWLTLGVGALWVLFYITHYNQSKNYTYYTRGEENERMLTTIPICFLRWWWWWWWLLLYSAILHSRADSMRSHVILHEWLAFVFEYAPKVVCLQRWHGWCHMKLQPSRRKFCVHFLYLFPEQ